MVTKKQRYERKGRWAETFAVCLLKAKGYRILARRFKTPVGEIDIIAAKKNLLVGVEVKARKTFDQAMWALTPHQQLRINKALQIFLIYAPKWTSADIRFDIILIQFPWIKHLKQAWSEER